MVKFWLKSLLLVYTTTIALIGLPGTAQAVSTNGVMIVELQTGGAADAGAEFVKIMNQSTASLSVDGWKLQYRSASGTSWTTKATLSGTVIAGDRLLIATAKFDTTEPKQTMQDGLAQAGGHIQILDASGAVHDLVGWGTAVAAETVAAPAPEKDQSLVRKSTNGSYIDTDNNGSDFDLEVMPLPPPPPPPPSTPPAPVASPKPTVLAATSNQGLSPPQITELLPNPASPQSDAHDEFVELFNPNAVAYSLKNYKLQSGKTFSNSVSLAERSIPANSFLVITSAETSLTLSNTSGGVRLVDPGGSVIAEVQAYEAAAAGQAWASIDGSWQWTNTPTPGAANVLASNTQDDESSQSTTAKNSTKPNSKTKKSTSDAVTRAEEPQESPKIHLIIIALVASLAVGYAIYEYRHDLGNLIYRFRTYRENRRSHRQAAARR